VLTVVRQTCDLGASFSNKVGKQDVNSAFPRMPLHASAAAPARSTTHVRTTHRSADLPLYFMNCFSREGGGVLIMMRIVLRGYSACDDQPLVKDYWRALKMCTGLCLGKRPRAKRAAVCPFTCCVRKLL
jgi:hypothetical protein